MLRTLIQESFTNAICNEENWNEGKLNINFVNADVYMDIPNSVERSNEIDPIFDEIAEKLLVDIPVEFC